MLKRIFFLLNVMFIGLVALGQEFPPRPSTLVTDYTNTLSAAEKQRLEDKLVAFNDSTSTQVAVVLIKSVGSYDISQYGTLLIRNWGIGQKDKNNGVLLLAAMNDRKVTIQTGYGVEGSLTDAATQQIIQQDIKPNFKAGNYFEGLDKATDHIISYTKGEFKADAKTRKNNNNSGGSAAIIIIIVVVILIIIFKNRGGGGGQIIGRRGGASPFWWFLAGSMLGGSGRRSGGGFGGGGSWGGGGSGGFGGFGGGSAGGGGSSGSW